MSRQFHQSATVNGWAACARQAAKNTRQRALRKREAPNGLSLAHPLAKSNTRLPTQTEHKVHQRLPAKGRRRLVPGDFSEQLWILEIHLVARRVEAPVVERVLEIEAQLQVPAFFEGEILLCGHLGVHESRSGHDVA